MTATLTPGVDWSAPPSRLERAVDRVPFLEKELFLLRRLVRPGDVCVDIGAAGGAHLFVMARQAGRWGHVVGIEPRPGSLRVLDRLVRISGMADRVSLHQLALTDAAGTIELRVPVVPTARTCAGRPRMPMTPPPSRDCPTVASRSAPSASTPSWPTRTWAGWTCSSATSRERSC